MKGWAVVMIILGIVFLGLIGWHFARIINYKLSYHSMVEDTVREMVRPECILPGNPR